MNNSTSPKLKSFKDYYLGVIFRPRRTFDALLADDRRLRFGLLALSISVVLYTLVYVFLTIGGGAPSAFTPFLAIPKEFYYYYNQFFLAPSMFMGWILAAGVAQLLSRPFSGKGRFEDMLSVFGFGISIACLASLAHDLPDTFLGAIGLLDLKEYEVALNSPTIWRTILWVLYSLYFILFFVLFPKGVGAVQRIRPGPAVLVGVLAALIYLGVFVIFNR
ncbi:MAG: hypothetical protein BroJett011_35180 [Chloroflexota bacterium]|nr:MAG: hypothetical protein BroJett011_35180 [Chloroflexota bacterium]